jgi:hypothetical protein
MLDKAVELTKENVKLLVTLATGVLGAASYYAKNNLLFTRKSGQAIWLASGCAAAAVFSIFFGHLHLTNLRNQLALGVRQLDVYSPALLWPERLQYVLFLLSLAWFAMLALIIEPDRALGGRLSRKSRAAAVAGKARTG